MLVVNLFGGPGAGKTTTGLGVTHALKKVGVDAEFVPEYARELVFEGTLSRTPQEDIMREQSHRLLRLFYSRVPVAVTDSPLLMQKAYAPEYLWPMLDALSSTPGFCNQNYFIKNPRTGHHSMVGRAHTQSEARELDGKIKQILADSGQVFREVSKSEATTRIVADLMKIVPFSAK